MVTVVLLVVAALCFLLGAMELPSGRVNLLGLGLFFWVLVPLLAALGQR